MTTYTIQRGDTLSKIAKQFGVSLKQLQEANKIKNANLIFAGKTLSIPTENNDAFKIPGLTVERMETNEVYADNKPSGAVEAKAASSTDTQTNKDGYYIQDYSQLRCVKVKVVDTELLNRNGVSVNDPIDPEGKAQYVKSYDEDILIGKQWTHGADVDVNQTNDGDFIRVEPPSTITVRDNSNGVINTYVYKRISKSDDEQVYYVLESVVNEKGENIKASHKEVYRLEAKYTSVPPVPPEPADGQGKIIFDYSLIQDKGMAGSGKSSIDYSKRKG